MYDPNRMKVADSVAISVSGLSVKLSGPDNYLTWKTQMLCLLDSMNLADLIDIPFSKKKVERYDTVVKILIFNSVDERFCGRLRELGSAQRVWRELESIFQPSIKENEDADVAPKGFIFRTATVSLLAPVISDYYTKELKVELYEASFDGCWWKAKALLINIFVARLPISENGGTMLHVAVEMGHNYFVRKLLAFLEDELQTEIQDTDGRTALHIAAMTGNKCAAELLVKKNKRLLDILDRKARSPLDVACICKKLNIYLYLSTSKYGPSGKHGRGIDQHDTDVVKMVVSTILTKQYRLATQFFLNNPRFAIVNEEIYVAIIEMFPTDISFEESFIYHPSLSKISERIVMRVSSLFHFNVLHKYVDDILLLVETFKETYCRWMGEYSVILIVLVAILYLIYEFICLLILLLRFPFSVLYFLLLKIISIAGPLKSLEKKKQEYNDAKHLLSIVCGIVGKFIPSSKETVLEAVRQDAYLILDEILYLSPDAINYKDEEGHNVIQLAIKHRSEKVFNLISHLIERKERFRTMEDPSWNNLLHLAVRLAPSSVLSRTTGAALQLQRELRWREKVRKFMSPSEQIKKNMFGETPTMLFNSEHKDLITRAENWMKTTAESCSITAALIVTVVFAAAITVPGGNDQQNGLPLFRNDTAFKIFAVSNAFSLFTSATALLLFLSILTQRFSQRDFLVSLPTRLIFGLFTLFLATCSMILTFGAILFLVFPSRLPWMLPPLAVLACFPISVIVFLKLSLLMDLFHTTYYPIYDKQTYLSKCKTNLKNTSFLGYV